MAKTFNIKSPAKINVGLRVPSKRPDGYHNIETIFYPVKIYDEITIKIGKLTSSQIKNNITVKTKGFKNIRNEENICYKAADLFLKEFKIKNKYKIEIDIEKKIPMGAGLGGGSSDAASTLKTLCKYFNKSIKGTRIKKLALMLGSDAPFFLLNKPAYAESRGEKLTPLPHFKIRHKILIVNPGIHVSTKEAYQKLRITNGKLQIKKCFNKLKTFKLSDKDNYVNDFERVVFKRYPEIKDIKEKMYKLGSVFSMMSGSGSTVYGLFTPQKIKAAEKFFCSPGYKVFIG